MRNKIFPKNYEGMDPLRWSYAIAVGVLVRTKDGKNWEGFMNGWWNGGELGAVSCWCSYLCDKEYKNWVTRTLRLRSDPGRRICA